MENAELKMRFCIFFFIYLRYLQYLFVQVKLVKPVISIS